MATIRAVLKTWYADKKGRHLVLLSIEAEGRTKYVSLGVKVRKKQWSKTNQRVLPSTHRHAEQLNAELDKKLNEATAVLNKMKYEEAVVTVDTIKERITSGHNRGDFWDYADAWLEQKRRKQQIYYYRRSKSILKNFGEFSGRPLPWKRLSVTLLREFDVFLAETKNNSANTRRGVFRVLSTMVREAVRESIISPQDDPFYRFKPPKATTTHRARLTLDEITRMEALDLSQESRECVARDMYILAFRMRGARFGDMVRLRWSSVAEGRITYVARKTGDPVSVPISGEMQAILDRYTLESEDDEFVFPPLRRRLFADLEAEAAKVASVNARVNAALKLVAEKAKISKSVSFHTARHSFASIADQMGIDHGAIQAALKHKNRQTTDIYLKSLDDVALDDKLVKVFQGS